MHTETELRYSRQRKLLGEEGQRKLSEASVFIAGIGGLGGTAAIYLAAAGIGKIIFAHEGTISLPDLNRQILMDSRRLGEARIPCAADSLKRINPNVVLEGYPDKISDKQAHPWVKAADIVIDARYDFPERYELNRLCAQYNKPMVEAAMYGYEVSVTTILPGKTACLACAFPEQDQLWEPFGFPVLGATSGIAGCLAAMEVIKVLTGQGNPLYNKLYRFDALNFHSRIFKLKRHSGCKHCGVKKG
ncbi:Molybdopterin or thiamine biosynthesis adenylyltransferase [Evansella caseinilytica]|uniref:Molybdopterin or thiamine biosynthesis adenylyltransferase n=1 Tax=Evansella caseinilytica TaxID=1503961 RepID=A0A1H3I9K3_9BACI|nr:HesA/MoeB/ThiF family protein [Evansella caseinilytica]SDY24360.1 Molybdopterin or thiamine biosynthesis adenylyltransferase [Evansella caseinilytica]